MLRRPATAAEPASTGPVEPATGGRLGAEGRDGE
jgi:hypothetical protein